jgi:hypothetical protein
LVIRDILPSDIYAYLLSTWPEEDSFDRNSVVRKRLPVTQGCSERRALTSEQKEAWETFGEIIVNNYIKEKTIELFSSCLPYKCPFLDKEQIAELSSRLQFCHARCDGLNLDKYGYSIDPHVDQSHIFAAILLYFPSDTKHVEYGTVLYKSLVNRTSIDVVFPPKEEFVPVKTLPFLPNTLVVFLQTPSAWHGVELITEEDYIRKAYHATVSLKPELVEEIYGSSLYQAEALYSSDLLYLDPKNFCNY